MRGIRNNTNEKRQKKSKNECYTKTPTKKKVYWKA